MYFITNKTTNELTGYIIKKLNFQFGETIAQTISITIEDEFKNVDKLEVVKNIANTILGKPINNIPGFSITRTKQELFVNDLADCVIEIVTSFEKLQIPILRMNDVNDNEQISRIDLMNYYFENHLNELYLYSQRVKKIFDIMEKKSEKLRLNSAAKSIVENRRKFLEHFNVANTLRHNHIHSKRYNDMNLKQLRVLEIIKKMAIETDRNTVENYLNSTFEEHRNFYLKVMENNVDVIYNITNEYLNSMENIFIMIFNNANR